MGYGARALQALNAYYSGEYFSIDEEPRPEESYPDAIAVDEVCFLLFGVGFA
jgi:N-acetyltransferase 10